MSDHRMSFTDLAYYRAVMTFRAQPAVAPVTPAAGDGIPPSEPLAAAHAAEKPGAGRLAHETGQLLHTLVFEHPDRNRPLAGCHYRVRDARAWRAITPAFQIAESTYNDLGDAWTRTCEFCLEPHSV